MAATDLLIHQQPVGGTGTTLSTPPIVYAVDDDAATVVDYSGECTATLTPGVGTPAARLMGPTTVPFLSGVATFNGLSVPVNGTNYTITFTSGSLTSVASDAFTTASQTESTALSEIRKDVRFNLGWPVAGTGEPADYTLNFPRVISNARNFIVRELALAELVTATDEVQVPISGGREYDLTRQGFLSITSVAYGTTTARVRLEPRDETGAMVDGNPNLTGTPAWYYADGAGRIGFLPVPTDTSQSLWVTGARVLSQMVSDTDTTGLSQTFNEAIALKAAIDIAGRNDAEQPEHQTRLPALKQDFDICMRQLKRLLRNFQPLRGGFTVAPGASDSMVRRSHGRRY